MREYDLNHVFKEIETALEKQDFPVAERWLWPALDQFPDHPQLLFYSSHIYVKQERYTAAYLSALHSMDLAPNGYCAANLGAICRRLNKHEEAVVWLTKAVEYDAGNKHAWNNIAAAWVNEGNPWIGIQAARKALAIDPKFDKARWNMGLLKLEAGDFETGWDDYRVGLASGERMDRQYGRNPQDPPLLLDSRAEMIEFRREHGRKPRVVIWGEQGIGDEIMFSTIIPDLAEDAEIIFECHPRLINIHKASFDGMVAEFYPTRKEGVISWQLTSAPIDFKCPMGDLGRFYRRSREAFNGKPPPILADAQLVDNYSGALKDLEGIRGQNKPIRVGFAYTGGIIKTMRWYRSIDPMLLAPVLNHPDVLPISLQYEDEGASIAAFNEKFGRPYCSFPALTQHFDYAHTCALVESLDCVITVCQSVAHLAAAMGKTTYVMVPQKCAWRYGVNDEERWFFYPYESVHLLRSKDKTGWGPPIARLQELLKTDFGLDFGELKQYRIK